jgi:GGDEF domain-containing protein
MIETLCLAAEITAAILLLSIGLPRRRPDPTEASGESDSRFRELLGEHETALRSLQVFSLLPHSQSPHTKFFEADEAAELRKVERSRFVSQSHQLLVSQSLDPITKLPCRAGLEQFLARVEDLRGWLEGQPVMAFVHVDRLEIVENEHGAVATEHAVRSLAEVLRDELAWKCYVTRFNHRTFSLVWLDADIQDVLNQAERLCVDAANRAIEFAEKEFRVSVTIAISQMNFPFQAEELWEFFEDGLATAVAEGGNRCLWYDTSESTWKTSFKPTPEVNVDEPADSAITPTIADEEVSSTDEPNTNAEAASNVSEDNHSDSSDSVANAPPVVTADDIAALFQAAQVKNRPAKKETPTSLPEPPVESNPAVEKPDEVNLSEKATDDDIAALFATVKSGVQSKGTPKPTPAPDEPLSSEPSSPEPSSEAAEKSSDLNAAASEDDIAALFAAFKK